MQRIKVKKLRQVQTDEGLDIVEEIREGNLIAVKQSEKLYKRKPKYSPQYRKEKKESKFPVGTDIYQVQLDGDHCARNFTEADLVT